MIRASGTPLERCIGHTIDGFIYLVLRPCPQIAYSTPLSGYRDYEIIGVLEQGWMRQRVCDTIELASQFVSLPTQIEDA